MSVRARQAVTDTKGDVVRYWPPPFPPRYKPALTATQSEAALPTAQSFPALSDTESIVIAQRTRRKIRGGMIAPDAIAASLPLELQQTQAGKALLSVVSDEQRSGKLPQFSQSEVETSAAVERVSRTDIADDWRFAPLDGS